MKVRELIDEYLRGGRLRGIGATQEKALRPIRAGLGERTPSDLTTATIEKYVEDRRAGMWTRAAAHGAQTANGTIRRELSALTAVLNWSVRKQLIPAAPAIDLPPPSPPRENFLTEAQANELWQYALNAVRDSKHRTAALFTLIAMDTWARAEAIETLDWQRVDMDRRQIDFRDPSRPETLKRRVPVAMSPRLHEVLSERDASRPLVVGPVSQYAWRQFMATLPERLWVTRHDLRRTGISLAIARGVPPMQVAQMAGDNLVTILKHYARFAPDYLNDVWKVQSRLAA